jgi:methyl-accepting chemotaxis protein
VTTAGAEDSRGATAELARMSAALRTLVGQFQY